jgi:glutamyl-Q tRNA(Asp) synthetase
MTSPAFTSDTVTTPTGRFAPSPTGPLHYGSLLAAVASYLNIRSQNGTWLVRIDDLDPPREIAGAASDILHTLESLGLHWDKDILYQSRRLEAYDEALARLQKKKLIYLCSCSRKDIVQRGESIYTGHCRSGYIAGRQRYAIRLKVSKETLSWHDMIQGSQFSRLFQEHGDFVVRRADGLHAYHLAVVLDDDYQNITESIRGADLLSSTSAQMYLQNALDIEPPQYAHIPVAVNTRGEKLSKQTGAEPISMHDPARSLFKALQDLGQSPPQDLQASSIRDILNWGKQNWALKKIPSKQTL